MGKAGQLEESAQLLAAAGLDVMGFHCTAAATIDASIGAEMAARIQSLCKVPAVATSQALLAALAAFGATRIVLITPYVRAVNEHEVEFFASHGIEVLCEIGLGKHDAKGMASIEPDEWIRQALGVRRNDAQAYVLSCANIRVAAIIGELERQLQAPVITSNQAMLWHCLRTGGINEAVPGYGALLEKH
jgi:maleate isomerase